VTVLGGSITRDGESGGRVEPEIGEALGASTRFVDRIGSGAAGEVWRVRDVRDESLLAAKILRREHAQDADLVERFIRERTVLSRRRHPHVVVVRDLVVEGERLATHRDRLQQSRRCDLRLTAGARRDRDQCGHGHHGLDRPRQRAPSPCRNPR